MEGSSSSSSQRDKRDWSRMVLAALAVIVVILACLSILGKLTSLNDKIDQLTSQQSNRGAAVKAILICDSDPRHLRTQACQQSLYEAVQAGLANELPTHRQDISKRK